MTLAELVSFICAKVRQTDAAAQSACKTFLTQRARMMWDSQLWKDSLVEYQVTLGAEDYTNTSVWLPTKGVLLLPTIIGQVVGVRAGGRALLPTRPELYYRRDFEAFNQTGEAVEFTLLSPAVWEWEAAQTLVLTRASETDAGPVLLDLLQTNGTDVERTSQALAATETTSASTERIDRLSKPAGAGTLAVGFVENSATSPLLTLAAAATGAPLRQRLRFTYIPGSSTAVRVLGKRTCPTFTEDTDEPPLRGLENALIAYVCGDMLQRERQYAKAQVMQAEGAALLAELVKVETVQQAFHVRIIPDDGYGEECGGNALGWNFGSSGNSGSGGSDGSALYGAGSPEGLRTASPGATYVDTDSNGFWVKVTGTGNTGWQQLLG